MDGTYTVHFCYLGTKLIHLFGTMHVHIENTFENTIFGRNIHTLNVHHHILSQLGQDTPQDTHTVNSGEYDGCQKGVLPVVAPGDRDNPIAIV